MNQTQTQTQINFEGQTLLLEASVSNLRAAFQRLTTWAIIGSGSIDPSSANVTFAASTAKRLAAALKDLEAEASLYEAWLDGVDLALVRGPKGRVYLTDGSTKVVMDASRSPNSVFIVSRA